MQRIHIIGRKNHGKTTLVSDVITFLTATGLTVGAIKHTGHSYPLDKPGSDSDHHAKAGASPNAFVSGNQAAIWVPINGTPYEALDHTFAACDLVLVEGDRAQTGAPIIEVWRDRPDTEPAYALSQAIDLMVSDDPPPGLTCPALPRQPVAAIAEWICQRLGLA